MEVANEELLGWFKDHRATFRQYAAGPSQFIHTLDWAKPGTGIFAIHYLVRGRTLLAYGDLGEAVYQWSSLPNGPEGKPFDWLSSLHSDYFASKCTASEVGLGFRDWDADTAISALDTVADIQTPPDALDCLREDSEQAWHHWLASNERDVVKLFGEDWWEWLPNIGRIIHHRCRVHLLGIKAAVSSRTKKSLVEIEADGKANNA